jgi:hypothetical protein
MAAAGAPYCVQPCPSGGLPQFVATSTTVSFYCSSSSSESPPGCVVDQPANAPGPSPAGMLCLCSCVAGTRGSCWRSLSCWRTPKPQPRSAMAGDARPQLTRTAALPCHSRAHPDAAVDGSALLQGPAPRPPS